MATRYDLVVIGSGPAGEKGAAQAAYFGKRVAVVERAPYLGGSGINTGTVPSKTLRETALYFSGLRQRGLYGIDYSLKDNLSVNDFMHREQAVVRRGRQIIQQNLDRHRIDVIWGDGTIRDPHTVRVRTREGTDIDLETDFILVATGSAPHHPPDIPFDACRLFDSDSILRMPFIPKSMAVVGGGVIGCEYASVFAALGVRVTLLESHGRILPFVDGETVSRLVEHLGELGLHLLTTARLQGDHRGQRATQTHLLPTRQETARCAPHRRDGLGTHPHRGAGADGGPQPRRIRRRRLQPPNARRHVQIRRVRRAR